MQLYFLFIDITVAMQNALQTHTHTHFFTNYNFHSFIVINFDILLQLLSTKFVLNLIHYDFFKLQ